MSPKSVVIEELCRLLNPEQLDKLSLAQLDELDESSPIVMIDLKRGVADLVAKRGAVNVVILDRDVLPGRPEDALEVYGVARQPEPGSAYPAADIDDESEDDERDEEMDGLHS